ncbi:MAG: hypothetical protein A4E72_01648 [Syntrophus sp. PtaU1.Bin208]|nr:MAG: hypothetical protein A4E72_01648 [Syntrophus sp. PtaU1.Bin208]
MDVLYTFTKSLIDPVAIIVLLLAAGTMAALSKRKGRAALFLAPALVLLYGLSIAPVSGALCRWLEQDYTAESTVQKGRLDVVIVLGGGVVEPAETGETLPSVQTASRLLRAVQVFRESGAAHLLCSAKGIGRTSEGDVMAAAAERLGVPREKILVDPVSENTRGHAVEADRRFTDKTIRIGLVTSAYHLKRAEREFRLYFANVVPIPSDYLVSRPREIRTVDFVPNAGSLFKSAVALHEMTGNLWYMLIRS